MNWNQIQGDWKQFSGRIKEKWGKLTDDEVTTIAGQREQLIGYLQERYGYEKEQAEKELNGFMQTLETHAGKLDKRMKLRVTHRIKSS